MYVVPVLTPPRCLRPASPCSYDITGTVVEEAELEQEKEKTRQRYEKEKHRKRGVSELARRARRAQERQKAEAEAVERQQAEARAVERFLAENFEVAPGERLLLKRDMIDTCAGSVSGWRDGHRAGSVPTTRAGQLAHLRDMATTVRGITTWRVVLRKRGFLWGGRAWPQPADGGRRVSDRYIGNIRAVSVSVSVSAPALAVTTASYRHCYDAPHAHTCRRQNKGSVRQTSTSSCPAACQPRQSQRPRASAPPWARFTALPLSCVLRLVVSGVVTVARVPTYAGQREGAGGGAGGAGGGAGGGGGRGGGGRGGGGGGRCRSKR